MGLTRQQKVKLFNILHLPYQITAEYIEKGYMFRSLVVKSKRGKEITLAEKNISVHRLDML